MPNTLHLQNIFNVKTWQPFCYKFRVGWNKFKIPFLFVLNYIRHLNTYLDRSELFWISLANMHINYEAVFAFCILQIFLLQSEWIPITFGIFWVGWKKMQMGNFVSSARWESEKLQLLTLWLIQQEGIIASKQSDAMKNSHLEQQFLFHFCRHGSLDVHTVIGFFSRFVT